MWQRSFPLASMFVDSEGMLTSSWTGWTVIGLQIPEFLASNSGTSGVQPARGAQPQGSNMDSGKSYN